MRVLLIEDEPTTAKAIELMLTTEGFNVYSTDLGEEGIDLVELHRLNKLFQKGIKIMKIMN